MAKGALNSEQLREYESDGFVLRDEWGISYCPGPKIEIEEITDMRRWIRRLRRER